MRYRIAPPKAAQGISGDDLVAAYGGILTKAQTLISGWVGELVFVYLPYPPRFFAPDAPAVKAASERKKEMLALAKKVGVRIIDLEPVFDGHKNSRDLAYAASTHYSEAGYRLAAETIAKQLGLKAR